MKRYISMVLSLAIILCLATSTTSAFYTPDDTQHLTQTNKIVVNEYELLKELAEKTPAMLKSEGYASSEINAIKNYQNVYRDHIYTLQDLSDLALLKNGYTTEQIDTIRSFSGTDAEMSRLGAELRIYSSPALFDYTPGGRTTGRLAYNWSWTGIPAVKMRDMVAASWNNWYVTDDSSFVEFYHIETGDFYERESADLRFPDDNDDTAGAGHRFYSAKEDNYYYAKKGGGTFDLESDGLYQKDFSYYIEYGHATLSYNIGFSVSAPGGAAGSISWSVVTLPADSDKGNYRW